MKPGMLIPLIFILSAGGCAYMKPSPPPPQMIEVERLRSTFPVHPGFAQIPNDFRVASPGIASLSLTFKSDAPFAEVRRFYIEELRADGWQLVEDRKLLDWGRDMGGHLLEFRRGEYQIAIEKGGRGNDDWDYGINFSWNQPR